MKKIRPEDLEIKIRKVGDTQSMNELGQIKGNDKTLYACYTQKACYTQDDCDTIDQCKTNIYCDTEDGCGTAGCSTKAETNCVACMPTAKCNESADCLQNTKTCANTQSNAVFCCELKTIEGDGCGDNTIRCVDSNNICPDTIDIDCNTNLLCPHTNECQDTFICPASSDCIFPTIP